MSNIIFPCRRICCGRKANARLINKEQSPNKSNSNKNLLIPSSHNEKISNNFSQLNQQIHSDKNILSNIEIISTSNQFNKIPSDINLDRLIQEYIETINEYRFHLGLSPLELSNELTNRARIRATQLSIQNHVENTNRFNLIYNNEPIGETIMSCQAPVNNGSDLAKLIHDRLIIDLENGHLPKKRYTPILNPDCQFLGFGLARNKENRKDFIVIYYYPVKNLEEFWHINNNNSITK